MYSLNKINLYTAGSISPPVAAVSIDIILTSTEIALFPLLNNPNELADPTGDGRGSIYYNTMRQNLVAVLTNHSAEWAQFLTAIHNCPDWPTFQLSWIYPNTYTYFDSSNPYPLLFLGAESCDLHFTFNYLQAQIKRIQYYNFKRQNISQPLCSLKETAYTKISSFRKWSL